MRKISLIISLVATFFLSGMMSYAQEWQMKQARIMTSWSEKIDPENVLPEYPRPQMVRGNWLNLNGIWDFTQANSYHSKRPYDYKILVPFPMESAISGLKWTDLANQYGGKGYIYRRFFTIPENMKGKKILLHFGGVGCFSEIWIDEAKVGNHLGEYDPFYFDITSSLKTDREQHEISVVVQDYQNHGGTPTGKQKTNEKGIWYTPSTGIWQTVWLEAVNDVYIRKLDITPDIDKKEINITTFASSVSDSYNVELEIYDGEKLISKTSDVKTDKNKAIQIPDMKLWSPDNPFLYDLKINLYENGNLVDTVRSYFGMRKVNMGTFAGRPCILLNNEYIFQHGVLDQGYWPDGIYTAPSDEALKYDLEVTKRLGMNMTRKHIKIEPARWYYHCDKLGLLVWQDMPTSSGDPKYAGMGTKRDNFHREMKLMIENLKNHPSIIMWVVYNEGWDQPADNAIVKQGVDIVRAADSTRLVNGTSGWRDIEYGDIKDTHWYPKPNLFPNHENKRAVVCGEYGGITLRIDGHQWLGGSNMTYTEVKTSDALKNTFNEHTDRVLTLGAEGICAAVYTQITDVEDEENGLMTYDRKVIKVNEAEMNVIANKIKHNYTHGVVEVLPFSRENHSKANWKFLKTTTPLSGANWKEISYNDSDWELGQAPFGNDISLTENFNISYKIANWTTSYIYMRRTVEFNDLLTSENIDNLRAYVFHDEDCLVYLNGILIGQWTGFETRYQCKLLNMSQVKAAIKLGQPNVLAVCCKQTTGGQFVDIGFCLYDIERKQVMKPTSFKTPIIDKKNVTLQIIPNPTKSEFSLNIGEKEHISGISLFDISGKIVKNFSPQESYSIRDINDGIYIVRANTSIGQLSGRLLVNK